VHDETLSVAALCVNNPDRSTSLAHTDRARIADDWRMVNVRRICRQRFLHVLINYMKLFVSGIPSSGKTTFADRLRDECGFMHINFELLSNEFQQFVWQQHGGNLRWFFEEMSRFATVCGSQLGLPDWRITKRENAQWF
jgi:hypothetical protein